MTPITPEYVKSPFFVGFPDWKLTDNAPESLKKEFEKQNNTPELRAFYLEKYPDLKEPFYQWDGTIVDLSRSDGGPGSGNHGHAGVPGKVGGSAPGDNTSYRGVSGEKCKEYGEYLSGKTKAQIAKIAAKDPEFKALTDTISLYTQGGYTEQRKVAEKLVDGSFKPENDFPVGEYVQSHRFIEIKDLYKEQNLAESTSSTADGMSRLVGTINESEPYSGKLYRAAQDRNICKLGGDYEPFVIPEVGQKMQISAPTSFTTDKAVADKLMQMKMGDRIFYTIDEGANAVDVSKLSPYKQKEMLSCGTYEVVSVSSTPKKRMVFGDPTPAQTKRGIVEEYGSRFYVEYDVEIQLRQVGKIALGSNTDADEDLVIVNPEQFEKRMVFEEKNDQMKRIFTRAELIKYALEHHLDGGSGSGNWGHAGRPGKKGGSAGGGGVHNRMGSSEEGYTSFSKEKKKLAKPHKLSHEELSKCPNGTVITGMDGHYKKAKIEVWDNEKDDYVLKEVFVSNDWGDILEIDQVISAAGEDAFGLAVPDSANKNYLKPKGDDRFSVERRNNAFKTSEPSEADDLLREKTGTIWRGLDDESKDALVGYTQDTYININGSLRHGYSATDDVQRDTELLTKAISQSVLDRDMYLFRGMNSSAAETLFGLKDGDLANWSSKIEDLSVLVGKRGIDNGFMSCGTAEGKGFSSRNVQLKIFCPAGTQALYAEPFSAFGRGDKRSWDGVNTQFSFSAENETILQRGGELRIVNASWDDDKAIIEVAVLSQMNNTLQK